MPRLGFRISLVELARTVTLLTGATLLVVMAFDVIAPVSEPGLIFGLIKWMPLQEMPQLPRVVAALLAVMVPCIYAFLTMVAARLERGIIGTGTDGEAICLSPEAIERAVVRDVRQEVEEVVRIASCAAAQGSKGPRLVLSITVTDRASVPTIRGRVTDVVRNTLERLIGFSSGADVLVKVTGLSGGASSKSPKQRPDGAPRRRKPQAEKEV